jgi:hypothetical protein
LSEASEHAGKEQSANCKQTHRIPPGDFDFSYGITTRRKKPNALFELASFFDEDARWRERVAGHACPRPLALASEYGAAFMNTATG